jgi:hypothetical protein
MKLLRLFTLLILVSHLLPAQSSHPPATGTITGHVFLGDSHLPARMAYVTLLPVSAAESGGAKPAVTSAIVQTGLDGVFVMPNVLLGDYYVVASKLGYASPIPVAYIDPGDYDHAPKDLKDALATVVTPVTVAANRTSTADIVLNKGAAISGTVVFSDGEPYSQAPVSLLRKEKSGKWTDFASLEGLYSNQQGLYSNGARTDDQGNFRLAGLPAGEYLLRTILALGGAEISSPGTESSDDPDYRWDIYFGYGVRPGDAKTIQVKDGEESRGNIIEIPLGRLHPISGTVLSEESGAPVNRADVELHNADDDSTCTITAVGATGQFHFPYVADGSYTLKVTKAADIIRGKSDEKPLHIYADASQPLIVKGETNGISIQLKRKPPDAPTAVAQ